MSGRSKPLPSTSSPEEPPVDEEEDEESTDEEPSEEEEESDAPEEETASAEKPAPTAAKPARPPPPTFKLSTFLYFFLGFLGIWMLFDTSFRNSIAGLLGTSDSNPGPLYSLIGFHSEYLLLTMALAGAIEMLVTSLAYNYTTDWIKAAKVQKWSSAFRKVQMEAIRSGKKNRIAALKPYQERLTKLSAEVSIAQFKGMAITYFLLILLYSWIGLVIGNANAVNQTVALGTGSTINLAHAVAFGIPWWFLIFSLYTVPPSLVFRRFLKHLWLRRFEARNRSTSMPLPATEGAGGPA
jgi:uncharacterized membrane protein (DUF106 family)